ncbi:MAG TPA: HAMP domain-containing sensor histidine kinase [Stellaceae bacterium]|nr:HAMP domain-containing sensor histidine kinase [Stellaceae bacterium]
MSRNPFNQLVEPGGSVPPRLPGYTLGLGREHLEIAQSAAGIGSWEWDVATGNSLWSSEQFKLYGIGPDQAGTVSHAEVMAVIHPDDRGSLHTALNHALQTGSFNAEFRILRGNQTRWMIGRGTVISNDGDQPVRVVGITMDVTDRKQAEQALQDATRAKNRLLAAAGHDLKQPLQVVLYALEGMLEAQSAEKRQQLFERGDRAVGRLISALDSLLAASRLDLGGVQPVIETFSMSDVIGYLKDSFAQAASAKGLRLTLLPSSVMVRTDSELLLAILSNLMSNALKYTKEGGILVGYRRRGAALSIEVVDTGIGIPPDKVEKIFEEFQQVDSKQDGFGLGLSIVKRTADILGLSIGVSSVVGRGSRFTVLVPLARAR